MPTIINRILQVLVMSSLTITASAQDLLASRAPSDKNLIDVRSIKIQSAFVEPKKIIESEIYTSWANNKSVTKVEGFLPANFKVDLRGFHMPTPSRNVTSKFGPRWGRAHKGIDLKVYIGDTIVAAFDGKVRIVSYDANGWGYYVCIRHANGLETLYGHLSRQLVKENDIVKAGEPIGLGGNTGKSTGSHLHFETRLMGEAINPALMFDFAHQDVTGDYYISRLGKIDKRPAFPRAIDKVITTSASRSSQSSASVK